MKTAIVNVMGRRVWDSRGRPTVEAEVHLQDGSLGRAIAPAGASTGRAEAHDRRDGAGVLGGYGVAGAVASVNDEIRGALRGCDATDQEGIDRRMIELDGTADKSRLGANALVAVSMAAAHAAAAHTGCPLWKYLAGDRPHPLLPLPEIQIFGGGAHASRRVDVQDFMIIPIGAKNYSQSLEWAAEVYRTAAEILAESGLLRGVADEGGYWPQFQGNEQALDFLVRAIEGAGFIPGDQVAISLDIAASDFGANGRYRLAADHREVDTDGLCEMLLGWLRRYPIVSVEDPLGEDDPDGIARFTRAAGDGIQVVADDLVCTTAARIENAADQGAANAALIKVNQIGTLSEAHAALAMTREKHWDAIVSARSGETEDVTIMHLAVGWGVPQIKVGSFSRSERMAKWNEGLRIAETLDRADGDLPARTQFRWSR